MKSHNSFIVFLLLSCLWKNSLGCGGFFCWPQQPVVQAGETIAFGVSSSSSSTKDNTSRDVAMHVQINYAGPAEKFSWILPVMFKPDIEVGSETMFVSLFEQTKPTFTFNIDEEGSTTCPKDVPPVQVQCMFEDSMVATSMMREATVVEDGSVGPFDYVMIQPSKVDPGNSVFKWLEENGYDQPEEAFPLINYYAEQQQIFVALRLAKGTETGEIQPIVLKYTLPDMGMESVACVPIQLTSIAAARDMPIQIYLLSDTGRGYPTNYFHAELDDTQADWLGCRNSPNCYINDMRQRLSSLLQEEGVNGHAFVTEYAGSTAIMADSIKINVNEDDLQNMLLAEKTGQNSLVMFLESLAQMNFPDIPLVQTILQQYTTVDPAIGVMQSFSCNDSKLYQPQQRNCHDFVSSNRIVNNATGLVHDLMIRVVDPSVKAQDFVDSYKYLTRMYGQLSPEQMDKDPFFAFKTDLPDVSNVHKATAVPTCNDGSGRITGLDITIYDQVGFGTNVTFFQPAVNNCGNWVEIVEAVIPSVSEFDNSVTTMAGSTGGSWLSTIGLEGEKDEFIVRDSSGVFPANLIADLSKLMDSRVPDQTIMPYNRTLALLLIDDALNDENKEDALNDENKKDETEFKSSAEPAHLLATRMHMITMVVVASRCAVVLMG